MFEHLSIQPIVGKWCLHKSPRLTIDGTPFHFFHSRSPFLIFRSHVCVCVGCHGNRSNHLIATTHAIGSLIHFVRSIVCTRTPHFLSCARTRDHLFFILTSPPSLVLSSFFDIGTVLMLLLADSVRLAARLCINSVCRLSGVKTRLTTVRRFTALVVADRFSTLEPVFFKFNSQSRFISLFRFVSLTQSRTEPQSRSHSSDCV